MHTLYYYGLFLVFAIVAFMIVSDKNVADYIVISYKMIGIQLQRLKWMVIFHPRNPITTWLMNRKFR